MKKKVEFIALNGEIIPANDLFLSADNRAFQYGDGVFETMHYYDSKILFLSDHFERLKKGTDALRIKMPEGFTKNSLNKLASGLIKKNRLAGDVRIRVQVYRKEGGFYSPLTNDGQIIINVKKLSEYGFVLNKNGLSMGICTNVVIPLHAFQNLKTCNSIPYVMAGIFAEENKLDDCLLLNNKGKAAETISSNVFIIKNGTVYTPPLKDGCVAGVMRKQMIQLLEGMKITIKEKTLIPADFKNADEIFLTNVIQGMRWVEFFDGIKMKKEIISKIFYCIKNFIIIA